MFSYQASKIAVLLNIEYCEISTKMKVLIFLGRCNVVPKSILVELTYVTLPVNAVEIFLQMN